MKIGSIIFFTGNKDYPNGDVGIVNGIDPDRAFWLESIESFQFKSSSKYSMVGPPILGNWK